MPLLAGGRLRGRVDPGREGTTLVAKRLSCEPGAVDAMAQALREAAEWVGCDAVALRSSIRPSWRSRCAPRWPERQSSLPSPPPSRRRCRRRRRSRCHRAPAAARGAAAPARAAAPAAAAAAAVVVATRRRRRRGRGRRRARRGLGRRRRLLLGLGLRRLRRRARASPRGASPARARTPEPAGVGARPIESREIALAARPTATARASPTTARIAVRAVLVMASPSSWPGRLPARAPARRWRGSAARRGCRRRRGR